VVKGLWIIVLGFLLVCPIAVGDVGRITRLHPSCVYVDQRDNAFIVFGRDDQLRFRVWDNATSSWIGDAFNYETKEAPVHYVSLPTALVAYTDRTVTDLYVLFWTFSGYFMDYYKWSDNASSPSGGLNIYPEQEYRNKKIFGGGNTRWGSHTVGWGAPDNYAFLYDSRWSHKDLISEYHLYDEPGEKWYSQMVTGRIISPIEIRTIGFQPYGYKTRDEDGNLVIWISAVAKSTDGTDKILLIRWDPNDKQPLESFLGIKYQKGLKGQNPVGYVYRIVDTVYKGYEDCWHSVVKAAPNGWIYWVYINEKRQLVLESFTPYAIRTPHTVTELQWLTEAGLNPFPGWNRTILDTTEGVRNVALDVDSLTGLVHIAYSVEDSGGNVDYYYIYGGASLSGGAWNKTLLADDWATPDTDYGIGIAVNPRKRRAYIPRARFDPSDPDNSYLEYDQGAGAMAVAYYSEFVGSGSITLEGGGNKVYRGELFNVTVRANSAFGSYRLVVNRLEGNKYITENIILLYSAKIGIGGAGDKVEMMLWHAGSYLLEAQFASGVGSEWSTITNATLNLTSLETNKDVYIVTDWGYRADEPCNFSTYWNNITSSEWEVIFGKCYPDRGWAGDPPSAYDLNHQIVFRNETVMALNASSEGNWSSQILGRLMNYYARTGDTWVAVIRHNQTIDFDGLSGNLSVPSTCEEQSLVRMSAIVSGLEASGGAYHDDYVMVDVNCLDDPSISTSSFKIPIFQGNGSIVGSFSPAGLWKCTMYAVPTDPDEEIYLLDTLQFAPWWYDSCFDGFGCWCLYSVLYLYGHHHIDWRTGPVFCGLASCMGRDGCCCGWWDFFDAFD